MCHVIYYYTRIQLCLYIHRHYNDMFSEEFIVVHLILQKVAQTACSIEKAFL